MKKFKVIFAFLIFLLSWSYIFAETVEKEFKKTVPFIESGNVILHNINGSIEVKSWDKTEVDIKALIKVKAKYEEDAEDFLKEVKINIYESSSKIEIEVEYPERAEGIGFWETIFGWGKPNVSINFLIKAPKITNLNLMSANGNIKINDIEGTVYSKSTNGSINLQKIKGAVESKTTNGSIYADNIIGDIEANTTNGKISLKGITGNVKAKSTNGNINSEIVELNQVKEMSFRTTNGSIKIILPGDINVDFEGRTSNGKISTDFPISIQGEIKKSHISGKINSGGPLIYVRTTNGNISLLKLEI